MESTRDFLDTLADTLEAKDEDYGSANEKAAVLKRLFNIDGEIEVIQTASGQEAVVLGEPYDVRGLEEESLDGMWTRFLDKVSRAHRLTFHGTAHVDSEPKTDAYDDMVGYAVRMAMLARGEGNFKHHGRLKYENPWSDHTPEWAQYYEIQDDIKDDEVEEGANLELAYGDELHKGEDSGNPWAEYLKERNESRDEKPSPEEPRGLTGRSYREQFIDLLRDSEPVFMDEFLQETEVRTVKDANEVLDKMESRGEVYKWGHSYVLSKNMKEDSDD